jgi:hypothetical protein
LLAFSYLADHFAIGRIDRVEFLAADSINKLVVDKQLSSKRFLVDCIK